MKRPMKNNSPDMDSLTKSVRKKLKIKDESPDDITKLFKKQKIQEAKYLTEDEEYEVAMKELKELVKTRVDTHLKDRKMDVDESDPVAKKRKQEKEYMDSLLDKAWSFHEKNSSNIKK